MGKPYSNDLRRRFVVLIESGMSARAAGRHLLISASSAVRWAAAWRRNKRDHALAMGGDRRSAALEAEASEILDWIDERSDLTLRQIVARLGDKNVAASERSVGRLFARHDVTLKKNAGGARTRSRGRPTGT